KRTDESIPWDKKSKSSLELFKVKTYVDTIFDGVERCKETIARRTYSGYLDPSIQNTIEANFSHEIRRINAGLEQFHKCLNEEMVADLRYFNSLKLEVDSLRSQLETQKTQFLNEIGRLSREYHYADHMNAILSVYTELDEVTNLQCDYLELLEKYRVMRNNSQGKKQEVEDPRRNVKLSKNKTSVTACNDSLNAKTLNVNFVSTTCDKYVLNDKHDMCVLNSVAKPLKKIVASESNQKPRNITRKLYERVSKACSWWYPKFTPSGYKWKPKSGQENVNPNLIEIVLFIVDSGCSKHMTGNLKLLINFMEKFFRTVKFGNDQIAPLLGYGDLVQGAITIKWVYYVKGLNHNLFSVGQFCDADLEVAFRKLTCYIRDLKGNDLLTGSCGTDLYSITLQDTNSPNLICLMAKATSSQAWLWHRRLSHLNFDTINLMLKNDIMVGLPKLKFVKDHLCSSCELGKAKRKSFHTKITPSSKRRLQLLHLVLCGPMRVASINGKRYVLVTVNDYSGYTWTHFLRTKDETPEVLIDFLRLVQRGLQAQVRIVRTDKGTKFLNQALLAYFATEGIHYQTSVAQTPEQNGIVERRNRTLVEAARTMLSVAKVPLFFWAEAITTTCFTQNRSLLIPRHEKTPYHIINERKPSVKFFQIFGSLCYIVRYGENLDKMKEKGDACIFMGYSTQSRAYRVFNKRTRVIVETIHVNFDKLPQIDRTVTMSNELDLLFSPMFDELLNRSSQVMSKSSVVSTVDAPNQCQQQQTTPLNNHITPESTCHDPTQATSVTSNENMNQAEMVEKYAQVEHDEFINIFCTLVHDKGETSSRHVDSLNMHTFYQHHPSEHRWTKDHPLEQVIRNPSQSFRTRCQLELDGEMCMFTLTMSRIKPKNIKESMANSAWIESISGKTNVMNRILSFETNLALWLRDMRKRKELISNNHSHLLLDSFLYGPMKEEVYVNQPDGFVDPYNPDKVYRLKKALYGLKQAPREWYDELSNFLIYQSPRGIFINQAKYAQEILIKHGMTSCDSVGTPMATKHLDANLSDNLIDQTKYHSMVRALMYLTASRLDIMYATCYCARYQAKLTEKHLTAIKRIFRYLKDTIHMGLWYPKDTGFELTALSNSDHAGCFDSHKSTSGGIQFLGGVKLVSWSSKKCHFIKEKVEKGAVELFFVGTEYQLVDLFTKALPEERLSISSDDLNSSTRTHQTATRNRGKAIVNSPQPIYDQEPFMVDDDDETSKDKEIDKLMALISLSFKKIYKPTNNNLRTSSNTSRTNQDNSLRIHRNAGYESQRSGNVAGAREIVGLSMVQKFRIQCYNCKEYGHVARECQKPKRAKDAAYHQEKMLLCKQEEAGIQLNAEQVDWKDDTDDESDDQELEAHYMYMAKIQELSSHKVVKVRYKSDDPTRTGGIYPRTIHS
nr:hypothetical protein [Tanacetum cinerariifolium]